jgi:hypothetical protein
MCLCKHLRHGLNLWCKCQSLQCHPGDYFQGQRDLDRFGTGGPPGEWAMVPHQHGRIFQRRISAHGLDNYPPGMRLIGLFNLLLNEEGRRFSRAGFDG